MDPLTADQSLLLPGLLLLLQICPGTDQMSGGRQIDGSKKEILPHPKSSCGRRGTMNVKEILNINSKSRSREAEDSKEQQPASATS